MGRLIAYAMGIEESKSTINMGRTSDGQYEMVVKSFSGDQDKRIELKLEEYHVAILIRILKTLMEVDK